MIHNLRVKNFRCFADIDLPITQPTDAGSGWTILVGENGSGKTSLLQAIVLAIMDARPLTILDATPWTTPRQGGDEPATVSVDAEVDGAVQTVTKRIARQPGSYIEAEGEHSSLPILAMGFSARRRIARPGELPASPNVEVERVRPLFDPNLPLLAHDAFGALERTVDKQQFSRVVRDMLLTQLQASEDSLFPLIDRIELRGAGGVTTNQQLLEQQRFQLRYGSSYTVRVGVEDLSHGYQAMLGVVLEILVQATIAAKAVVLPQDVRAVILIDEIEAHLHPRWQRTVVPLLRQVFPRCQFVVTTHSPLVVGSARPGEVHVLDVDDVGDVRSAVLEERLSALDADAIYTSVFGVPRASSPEFVEQERRVLQATATGDLDAVPKDLLDLVQSAWADRANLAP